MSNADPAGLDEFLVIEEDEAPARADAPRRPWRVLVVDDDADIHETTRFALKDATILDRPIELLHAHSAAEARTVIGAHPDIAVALIDVVMETPGAGLSLIRELRETGYREMRIVLRTGQPGYAPELAIIAQFEIDDYRTKAELTLSRLLTILTACIRAYDQIHTIAHSRAGLEMIVESATQLFKRTNLELFSRGVLTQISGLLRVAPNGFVCVNRTVDEVQIDSTIICAAGNFTQYVGRPVAALANARLLHLIENVRGSTTPLLRDGYLALYLNSDAGHELYAIIESDDEIAAPDLDLLRLFSTNIAVGFENLALVERLDRLAYIDPILEVPNANAFEVALRERLGTNRQASRIALTSVDSFQTFYADYGPPVAHRLLRDIYDKLIDDGFDIRDRDLTVARVGDGTFALLGDRRDLNQQTVPAAFVESFHIDDIEVAATATTAIIDLGSLEPDPPAVMRAANAALLRATQTRRGECVVYDAAMRTEIERRGTLQIALKRAIETTEGFSVYLQPKVDLLSDEVVGSEALLRWQYQDTAISPAEFVPIAETAGLTQPLTDFVIDTVGCWARLHAGDRTLPVAVNLSMVDLNTPGFVDRLLAQVAGAGLSPSTVEFEVTEGIAMQDSPWAIAQVRTLKREGFRIALDDFGTGYSSLGNFDRLPIDTVKVDRSFVNQLDIRSARNSLSAVVVAMSEALGVDCVAEGIETIEQKQALSFLGCRIGQGYLLGHPVHIDTFDAQFLAA